MSKAASGGIGFAVGMLVAVIAISNWGFHWYVYWRDLGSVQTRAQVAADRDDMIRYTEELLANLRKHDATTGHAALVFKSPRNDLALQYESIERIAQRLHSLEGIKRNSTTYQVALDDIRGTLREVPDVSGSLAWVRYGWWSLLLLTFLFWPLAWLIGYVLGKS